jgi:ribosome-associated heat shock protein Hsp15
MTRQSVEQQQPQTSIRVDKWLWYCRAFKSRTMAAGFVTAGKVRVNRERIHKPGTPIHIGDVLTFMLRDKVVAYEVLALGERRGPYKEAQLLYKDLVEEEHQSSSTPAAE